MSGHSPKEVTLLLNAWRGGDQAALDKLIPLIHDELHRLARIYMTRERAGHTLQTTALLNEAYLRLIDANQVPFENRTHFFALSANLMRRVLVDFARSRRYQKRGGNVVRVEFEEGQFPAPSPMANVVAVDDALNALAKFDEREAKVVELRFFGGLSEEETAEALGLSLRTVQRDWTLAKAWLSREMRLGGSQ
jgi:RNA polymerase sigma factor (TIGR02999 family)